MKRSLPTLGYWLMALIALLLGIGLLVYYVREGPTLDSNFRNQVYYVVLFPSAVACAVALFGGMRSYARLSARQPHIAVQLGGPVVLFILVIWGGFKFVPPPRETFDLTVRARSVDGAVPVITTGKVTLDLENDRRTELFRPNGEADFKGVPAKFLGATVRVLARVDGYNEKWDDQRITGNTLDLALQPTPPINFRGFVHDEDGSPLSSVKVISTDCAKEAVTNDKGIFAFEIRATPALRCHLVLAKDGYISDNTDMAIDTNPDHRFLLRSAK